MKNFKLFLAFVAFTTVAVASNKEKVKAEVSAPVEQTAQAEAKSMYASAKDAVNSYVVNPFNDNVVKPVNAGFQKLDDAFNSYVVDTTNGYVVTPVVNSVKQVLARPMTTVVVAAAAYGVYCGYEAYADSISKKANSKN